MSDRRPATVRMSAAAAAVVAEFAGAAVALDAAPADGSPPTFRMVAYTGKAFRPKLVPPQPHPVVVDLLGFDPGPPNRPALKDHKPDQVVGHLTSVTTDGRTLDAAGVVSGTGPAAAEVVANHRNGFRWQTSIGADLSGLEVVPAGRTVTVNGRAIPGPVIVARKSRLREISFLSTGADDDTAASIAAAAAGPTMSFDDWLRANGFDPAQVKGKQRVRLYATYAGEATVEAGAEAPAFDVWLAAGLGDEADALDEAQTALLQSAYDAGPGKPKPKKKPAARRPATTRATVRANAGAGGDDEGDDTATRVETALATMQAMQRETEVRRLCGDRVALAASAIEGDWSDDHIRQAIRAADLEQRLPQTLLIRAGRAADAPAPSLVMEAAVCMAGGLADVETRFGERACEEANRQFHGRIGLQELILEAAVANGYSGRTTAAIRTDLQGVIRAACSPVQMSAGFSTFSLPGILSNSANKFLLAGFLAVEDTWREIAGIRSVSDFKAITSYRLNGSYEYEELAPDGKIKHGTLGEASYTNQARTYAKMLAITRTDIINDDLGALTAVPQHLGRGAKLKFNKVFWAAFMDNATFFTTGAGNYFSGAATNLSIDSLTTGEQKFLDQVDDAGNPMASAPEILLVPNALNTLATSLTRDTEIRNTTASTVYTTSNPHAGKFRPVRSSYLNNSTLTGYSPTAWYLLSGPVGGMPVVEVAFLNGRQEPVVETVEVDPDMLGMSMRGYHDFGVAKQEPRGGVKSKGAA